MERKPLFWGGGLSPPLWFGSRQTKGGVYHFFFGKPKQRQRQCNNLFFR